MTRPRPSVRAFLAVLVVFIPLVATLPARSRPAAPSSEALCSPEVMMSFVRQFSEPGGAAVSRLAYRTAMDTTALAIRGQLYGALGAQFPVSLWSFPPRDSLRSFSWAAGWDTTLYPYRHRFANVIGTLPGTAGDGSKFLITCHYDAIAHHTAGWRPWADPAPGADDNMSGTAAVLELARRLFDDGAYSYPFDIEFVCFDGEEEGMWGSDTLAKAYGAAGAKILGVFNIDMFGYNPRGDSVVVMTNTSSRFLADLLLETEAADPQPDFALTSDMKRLYYSDHAPFWDQHYPAVLLIEDVNVSSPYYHRMTDLPDHLSRNGRMMAKGANTILRALRRLKAAASGPPAFMPVTQMRIGGYETTRPAAPGDVVDLAVIAFNAGGAIPAGESQPVRFYRVDDAGRHPLGERTIDGPLITGGRRTLVSDPITIGEADAGSVRIDAEVGSGAVMKTLIATIPVKTAVTRVVRHYVAPNPVRDPARAWLCYELSRDASMRLTLFDFHGQEIGKGEFLFSGGEAPSGSGMGVGLNRVPLARLLNGLDLSPGVYLYRVEVFAEGATAGESVLGKFAVVR